MLATSQCCLHVKSSNRRPTMSYKNKSYRSAPWQNSWTGPGQSENFMEQKNWWRHTMIVQSKLATSACIVYYSRTIGFEQCTEDCAQRGIGLGLPVIVWDITPFTRIQYWERSIFQLRQLTFIGLQQQRSHSIDFSAASRSMLYYRLSSIPVVSARECRL